MTMLFAAISGLAFLIVMLIAIDRALRLPEL